ncbi:unnamed protein product [Jaminaea pallidilutea]
MTSAPSSRENTSDRATKGRSIEYAFAISEGDDVVTQGLSALNIVDGSRDGHPPLDAQNIGSARSAHQRRPTETRDSPLPLSWSMARQGSSSSSSSLPKGQDDHRTYFAASPCAASTRAVQGRKTSEPSITSSISTARSAGTVASLGADSPSAAPPVIPPRLNSRSRTRSEAVATPERDQQSPSGPYASMTNSTSYESSLSGYNGSPASVSTRGSSLPKKNRRQKSSAPPFASPSSRSGRERQGSIAESDAIDGRSDFGSSPRPRTSSQMEELLADSSDVGSAGARTPSRSIFSRLSRPASSAASSRMSIEIPSSLDDLSPSTGPERDLAQAVQSIREGHSSIVDARACGFERAQPQIDADTTHLLLGGCALPASATKSLALASQSLLVLDISNVGLAGIPSCIASCSGLEELNISSNPLRPSSLPSWIGELSSLRVLFADDLGLPVLPHSLSRLSELVTLSVRGNQLSHLPSWMHLLTKLDDLHIDGNPFKGAWHKVLSSLFPLQVQSARWPSANQGSPGSTGRSMLPTSPSNERTPFNEYGATGRVSRTQSPISPVSTARRSPLALRKRSDPADATLRDCEMQRQPSDYAKDDSTPSRDKVSKGRLPESEGRWNLLRRVGRKSSVGSDLHASSSSPFARPLEFESDSDKETFGGSGQNSSVSTRGPHPFARFLSSSSSSSPSQSRRTSATGSQLMSAFEPLPTTTTSSSASSGPRFHVEVGCESQSRSYLTVGGFYGNDNDARATRENLRALMCYLRDLDDLAPKASSRRRLSIMSSGISPSNSASSNLSQSFSFSDLPSSPAHRRPSGALVELTSESAPLDIKDDSTRRRRIIAEIISSEESYIRGLQQLCDIYVRPSRLPSEDKGISGGSNQPILPPQEHRAIFGNVEGLLQFHVSAFLPSLKTAADCILRERQAGSPNLPEDDDERQFTASVAEEVANVFVKHIGWFRMYSAYINGCDEAQTRIMAWMATVQTSAASAFKTNAMSNDSSKDLHGISNGQRKRFKAFIKRCRLDPRHTQLGLESYLLLPVQRIPRYELLLKDLAKSTDPKRLHDASSVRAALSQISLIAANVNESKRQSEQDRKLLAWQARLKTRWQTPLVQPHRRLVRDGTLELRRIVQRIPAFDEDIRLLDERPEIVADARCDGAYTDDLSRVECLQQQAVGKSVNLLVCNDVCVAVSDAPDANSPVDLIAFLRFHSDKPDTLVSQRLTSNPLEAPGSGTRCQIWGKNYLRVVDTQRVYYFTAPSSSDAKLWCDAINAVGPKNGVSPSPTTAAMPR